MEPLDVATTDWIKDYDPLFELFDEEMQTDAAGVAALAASTSHTHHHQHQSTWSTGATVCETYLTPISDYYFTAASFAASSAPIHHHHQYQQAYHATCPAPAVRAVNSIVPTAPTIATTSYQGYANDGYDLSQYVFSNHPQQYQEGQAGQEVPIYDGTTPTETSATQTTATNYDTTSYVAPRHQHQQQQPQPQQMRETDELSLFLGLDWLPSLENELTTSESSSTISSSVSAPVTPTISLIQSESTSSSSSSAYSSLAPSPTATSSPCDIATTSVSIPTSNKKRRCLKSKGTSLLAQPSPKLITVNMANSNITSDVVAKSVAAIASGTSCGVLTTVQPVQITTGAPVLTAPASITTIATTPTSTPTRLLTKNVPILQLSRSASSHQQSSSSAYMPVTTTTATLLTYSNIANIARQNASTKLSSASITTKPAVASTTATTITISDTPKTNERPKKRLTKLEQTSRLCVKIEHDYAMVVAS